MIANAWLLAIVIAQSGVQSAANAPEVPAAAIHGHVLRPDGEPAIRAEVRLISAGRFAKSQVAVTDQDGVYRFDDLTPGPYRMVAQKSGFVSIQYGGRPITETPDILMLNPGELRDHVDIRLVRHSAITGRIVDENGDPVEGARVHAQQLRYLDGRYRLVDAFGARARLTDDRGRFRVYGLQEGSYIVSAVVGQIDYPSNAMVNLPGYAPTFYPGRARMSDAERVKVPAGQDVAIPDFALVPVRTARISGRAVNSRGEPITGGLVLRPTVRSGGVGEESGARIERDGTFEFRNVAPGEYVIVASKGRQRPSIEGEFAAQVVTVSGSDIEGLSVRTSAGSTISGHVIFEGDAAAPDAFTIEAYPVDFDFDPPAGGSIAHAELTRNLDFKLSGICGPRRFRLTDAPDGWMLKSVRVSGQDVTDDILSFGTAGESLDDVEIVLSRNGGEVSGTVSTPKGVPPDLYSVVVFPGEPAEWYAESRFLRRAPVAADGTFDIRGLPASDYFVVAVPQLGGDDWQDPTLLDALSGTAVRRLVSEGQNLSFALKPTALPRR